jgi:hypothetical protein
MEFFPQPLQPYRFACQKHPALQAAEKLVNAGVTVEERRFSAA